MSNIEMFPKHSLRFSDGVVIFMQRVKNDRTISLSRVLHARCNDIS
jgi:hypothetical protein